MKSSQDTFNNFLKADKPAWLTPSDCLVMVVLLNASIEHTNVWLSREVIALRAGVDVSSVKRSIKQLRQKGWISWVSGKRKQKTNTYDILAHNLPVYKPTELVISPEALRLADWYYKTFKEFFWTYTNTRGRECSRAKSIKKGWKERWSVVIQRHIDISGYEAVRKQLAEFANADLARQQQKDFKHIRFVRGPQCLPWSNTEKEAR